MSRRVAKGEKPFLPQYVEMSGGVTCGEAGAEGVTARTAVTDDQEHLMTISSGWCRFRRFLTRQWAETISLSPAAPTAPDHCQTLLDLWEEGHAGEDDSAIDWLSHMSDGAGSPSNAAGLWL
jgi:hypothetical protein